MRAVVLVMFRFFESNKGWVLLSSVSLGCRKASVTGFSCCCGFSAAFGRKRTMKSRLKGAVLDSCSKDLE